MVLFYNLIKEVNLILDNIMSHNKQYELEVGQEIEDYYVDQAFFALRTPGLQYSSGYTPYGIKCIDSNYCELIKNLHSKIKNIYEINRRKEIKISPRDGKPYESGYETFYDPCEITEGNGTLGIRVEWENGSVHDFKHGDKPVFDKEARNITPEQLRKSIKENINLHVQIKENLLSNLESAINLINL